MKQRYLNLIFILGLVVCLALSLRHEKTPTQTQPINYPLYKQKFDQLQSRYNELALQVENNITQIDSVKLKIVSDEIKINNLSQSGIDSAFAVLLSKR
jgi:hypothetical protein